MWGVIAALLVLPAIAMPFTHEVAWGVEDFAFAALILVGAGLLYELAVWKLLTARARMVAGALIVLASTPIAPTGEVAACPFMWKRPGANTAIKIPRTDIPI